KSHQQIHRLRSSEKKFGGVTGLLHRVNRHALMTVARRLTRLLSATPLMTPQRHRKLPISDLVAEIRWRSLRSERVKLFWILVLALASIVFLPLVLLEKAEK